VTFQKDGVKRRRCTRRDKLREGQFSQYPRDFHPKLVRRTRLERAIQRASRREAAR